MKLIVLIATVVNIQAYEIEDFVNLDKCDQVINKDIYSVCYSYEKKLPLAVWYTINKNQVNKINIKKRPKFYNEKNINIKYRAKLSDYKGSKMDRGHLASDASFDYDKKALRKTYSLVNIVPQYPKTNRVEWVKAERYERLIATKLKEITVVNIVDFSEDKGTMGENKISIPTAFIKILFSRKEKYKTCLKYKNEKNPNKSKLKSHKVKCLDLLVKN